jgi:HAD superfamily hydrolase (TIGR01490 family)
MATPARRRTAPRIGAFFDMDKTLIAENSGSLYMKYRYERGEVDGWELAKGLVAYLRYKAGVLDIRAFTQQAMLEFRGESERKLLREARDFVHQLVLPTVYPEAIEAIRHHQQLGHVVTIVSGATKFVVKPLAEALGIRHYLYTRLEVEHGRFTGRVIDPICFEEGKIYWLQQFIDERGIDLAKSWFYTDSITDLPLMDLVGHPVAVNPDPFLFRAARGRGWPIKFFERPGEAAQVSR